MKNYIKPVIIWIGIFLALFILSAKFVEYKEAQCVKQCRLFGAKNHNYKGYTGGYRRLYPDNCSCVY